MLIMYLLGMLFHPANVSSLTFALEVKSCSALCDYEVPTFRALSSFLERCFLEIDFEYKQMHCLQIRKILRN